MLNYINFVLFLKASFVGGEAGSISYADVARKGPKNAESKGENQEDLSHLSPENQEKVQELRKEFENIKLSKKFVGGAEERLRRGLLEVGDPKDKEYAEVAQKIQRMQNELKSMGEKSAGLQKELSTLLGEVQTEIQKLSPEEIKALGQADSNEFLKIPAEKRLQYVTKEHTDSADIVNRSVKEVTFSFTYEGKLNQNLYKYTTAGQVFPAEVRSVTSKGETYERVGVNGEFYNKDQKRLTIHEGTNVSVETLSTKEEMTALEKESQNKFEKFIKENPKYAEKQYQGAIKEMYNKGFGNEDVMMVLNFSYEKLAGLDKNRAQKILPVVRHLNNSGLLDSFMDAGELVTKLEEIVNILKQYGGNLKYTIGEKGNIQFALNNKGLPEGLDVEPTLKKFTQLALSQIGTNEYDGGANKYFKDLGLGNLDAKNTPWCAAFVNWCLKMAGFKGTQSLSAKSFINSEGFGHVGIKLGDKLLGGNQGNKVGLMTINKPVAGYAIPSESGLEVHKPAGDISKIPDGAILVFDRTQKDKNMA